MAEPSARPDPTPAPLSGARVEARDLFDDPRRPDIPDAALRLLQVCATAYARWFGVVRACIRRERARQQLFREEHGLPKSARLPYERTPLTAAEQDLAAYAEDLIRLTFGDIPADYARTQFYRAIATGDLRAFKLRLLILKTRDALAHTGLHRDFVQGQDFCIALSEHLAGCTPDPSPRRLSRSEQQRRHRRELQEAKTKEIQGELQLLWEEKTAQQKQPPKSPSKTASKIGQDIEKKARKKRVSDRSKSTRLTPKNPVFRPEVGGLEDNSIKNNKKNKSEIISPVTCNGKKGVTVTLSGGSGAVVRKVRTYENIEQILEDIHEGKITPYDSTDEICADVTAGKITQVEALMFTMALDQYKPTVSKEILYNAEMESEFGSEEPDDEDEGTDNEDYDEPKEDRRSENRISYNPHGFCGYGVGHYADCGTDWNTDDE